MVVADTKPIRAPAGNGGCVGIFFKLFDWNRRFGNKKLFPKKLLPPAASAGEWLPISLFLSLSICGF